MVAWKILVQMRGYKELFAVVGKAWERQKGQSKFEAL